MSCFCTILTKIRICRHFSVKPPNQQFYEILWGGCHGVLRRHRTDGHKEACSNCISRAPTYEFPNPQCNSLIHNTCTLFPQFFDDFMIWSTCSFEKPFTHMTPICALSCTSIFAYFEYIGRWVFTLPNMHFVYLTFMGPCIVRKFEYISNKMQRYTVYFIWKLLYMFRVVPSPIIRSANSIWYLSHRYCYLLLHKMF
jgi:hypothetical protein